MGKEAVLKQVLNRERGERERGMLLVHYPPTHVLSFHIGVVSKGLNCKHRFPLMNFTIAVAFFSEVTIGPFPCFHMNLTVDHVNYGFCARMNVLSLFLSVVRNPVVPYDVHP